MDYPEWVTPSNLGTFSQAYSFDINPIVIQYGANPGSVITEINGGLPSGLRLEKTSNVIKIVGICVPNDTTINVKFTLRISQTNNTIADRTFYFVLNPIPAYPSWINQNTFLGYQNNTLPQSYILRATAPVGQHLTYSIQSISVSPSVPVKLSIGKFDGVLICDAANVLVTNTVITSTVRATANLFSDIQCNIQVITQASPPQWITPAGNIGTFARGDFLEYKLFAKDLNNQLVNYTLTSNPNNAPITVATDGLVYGKLDDVTTETSYTFTVKATNTTGDSYRTFSIIVVPSASTALLQWISDSNLGSITDGAYCTLQVTASTERNSSIVYNLVGGTMPPNLIIGITDGVVEGFCEYHAVPKLYTFDVSAYDGYQTIVKQFSLQVNKKYQDIFFGIDIPLHGVERNNWIIDAGNSSAREPGLHIVDTFENIENPPKLRLIRGVLTGYDNDETIYNKIKPYLHQVDLQFAQASNTSITDSITLVYRSITDYQEGTAYTTYSQPLYNTNAATNGIVTPISLANMRHALTENRKFVDSGGGSGLNMAPVLNWSTGSIESVSIINSGSNYTSPPTIVVSGSGSDAKLRAILSIVGLSMITSSGWSIGDTIEIKIGRYNTVGQITVTGIGTNGSIVSYSIDESGDYIQVPAAEKLIFSQDTYQVLECEVIWGVVAVAVLNGGYNYQDSISLASNGQEILPWWQNSWSPAIAIGNINGISGSTITAQLNTGSSLIYGNRWQPNYTVFYWEGLKWLGTSTFDNEHTTFDGDLTRFEEAVSAYETIFDDNQLSFDNYYTEFDYKDPLAYDTAVVWGATIFDGELTIFDFYATVFDRAIPKTYSNTLYSKLIRVNNKTYSGNNAVW